MRGFIALLLLATGELPFTLQNHPTAQKHMIETMPGGVAVFDYNNDGRPDIFFANGAQVPSLKKGPGDSNRLLRNDGEFRFTDVTEQSGLSGEGYSMGAAAADFDNDGKVDLFVPGVFASRLYRNKGDATFEDVSSKSGIRSDTWAVAAGWVDYDNDGWLDLLVVNYSKWTTAFNRFCGDQAKNIRVYCHPRFFEPIANILYRNRGDGTFQDVSTASDIAQHKGRGMSAAFADYDRDGYMDIFVTNDKIPNFLFHNIGGKRFEETGLLAGVALPLDGKAISGMGADFRDIDNDGLPDIHFTALNGETFPLFRSTGKGDFTDISFSSKIGPLSAKYTGWSNGIVDLNNDGLKDIWSANSHVNDLVEQFEPVRYKQPNTLFLQDKEGHFTIREFGELRAHRGGAAADFDGDGRVDIVTSALGAGAEIWRNDLDAGHWVAFRLSGRKSNRDGIGTVITVNGQTNHMTTATGYSSSSHIPVHFGLGAKTAAEVSLRWPSGIRQTLKLDSVDRTIDITEPEQ